MIKKLIFCFDGTCNDPEDVNDFQDDISISNILKLHALFGGKLTPHNGENKLVPKQHSFYYSGIGNRGNWLIRTINAAFAPKYGEMDDILSEAHSDLAKHYRHGDEVYIFGFSRGAAIARMFAAHLTMEVKFLGVFDTVAATRGSLDLNPNTFPASGIVFEDDVLAPHIEQALHLLALDEQRLWFQPTLFNHDSRVTEVWFAGSHSDIGGGFYADGLSDICLQFMINRIKDKLTVLPIEQVDFSGLKIPNSTEAIAWKDLTITADVKGVLHENFYSYGRTLTHAERKVRVNVNEQAADYLPIIDISVADRFNQQIGYQAEALRNVKYQLLNEQGQLTEPRYGIMALAQV